MAIIFGAPVIRRYDLLWRLSASLKRSALTPDKFVVVDNGKKLDDHLVELPSYTEVVRPSDNLGCSGAWNTILEQAEDDEDFVIIANDDMELHRDSLGIVAEASSRADFVLGHGFSLFGMWKRLVHQVGWFDENFFPAYFEDNDYKRRMTLAGTEIAVVDSKAEHGGSLPGGSASLLCQSEEAQKAFGKKFEGLRGYYIQKWGRAPQKGERFKEPFDGKPPQGWRERPITE